MKKVQFLSKLFLIVFLSTAMFSSCTPEKKELKISLAQWSYHRAFRNDGVDPFEFAKMAKELDIEGLEYVSQLYTHGMADQDKATEIPKIATELKKRSELHGRTNVLIMVDGEGPLASSDEKKRNQAILNHSYWVDAAATLGCTSIRVNLAPTRGLSDEEWHKNSVIGLGALADIAAKKNINVIVENHGGISSDGAKLAAVMAEINKSNCGTLPDFGNFCIDGSPRGDCKVEYDRYKGTKELMPYAKGVSAKSYDFDVEGNETKMDYNKLLQIVKDAGYTGFIGVEYEGDRLSEKEGIIATKELLLKIGLEY
ncbi:sugar phosphate isomerase/epimerase family protein [Urechidicola vernalis]|uniref:TIM barrel protein n=1 Tax=Urechidicola vernalis TaxID=3075600 RepID=A0ABU2Y5U6_9FLAO|nr:TIM barrel protein [Urechidicola sp. P050]MDT0553581.1 TIM barrel protein [Urechidicola sp. P050]